MAQRKKNITIKSQEKNMITIEIPKWFAIFWTIAYGIILYPKVSEGIKLLFSHLT